jgi:hypothetical protein
MGESDDSNPSSLGRNRHNTCRRGFMAHNFSAGGKFRLSGASRPEREI